MPAEHHQSSGVGLLNALSGDRPRFAPGEVWLVGAGPGDPGLLTLDALAGLLQADVVVHDALVDARVLALARGDAQRQFAGKRGGKPSVAQEDICAQLVTLARRGLRVLRLKGGDPFVFGRGGEEVLALAAAGIPFRVVPGVTAGLGGLASAHIPATMRGVNQAIILATGHDPDEEGAMDWSALARTRQPIVLYMGLRNLDKIAAALMRGGLPADTPAAVIASATLADQRILVSTLDRIAAEALAADLAAPAMAVIGDIVHSRRQLLDACAKAGVSTHNRPSHAARESHMRRLMLIGIGAGNPDYITLQAINALKQVDVIFVTDKGEDTADLLRARKDVCERHMRAKPHRIVEIQDPKRDRRPDAYRVEVVAWHDKRAALYEQVIREQLSENEVGAFLVWGDPSLYDSTLRIIDQVAALKTVEFDWEIIPGISSVQALAARHRIALNQIGAPIHITTGRRLSEERPAVGTNLLVMLDGNCAFKALANDDIDIFWGAYLGTPDEILFAGKLSELHEQIEQARTSARNQKGWIMDTYLLRKRGS